MYICARHQIPLELELQTVVSCHVGVRIEPRSSGGTVTTLNLEASLQPLSALLIQSPGLELIQEPANNPHFHACNLQWSRGFQRKVTDEKLRSCGLRKVTSFVDGFDCISHCGGAGRQSFDVYEEPSCLSWIRKTEKSNVIFNFYRVPWRFRACEMK